MAVTEHLLPDAVTGVPVSSTVSVGTDHLALLALPALTARVSPGRQDQGEPVPVLLPQPGELGGERLVVLDGHVHQDTLRLAAVAGPVREIVLRDIRQCDTDIPRSLFFKLLQRPAKPS